MVLDSILLGGVIGAGGLFFGYKQWSLLIAERQVTAALNLTVKAKNQRIAQLEADAERWRLKRQEIARKAALALGKKRRAARDARIEATRAALGNAHLRPRDEVVAGVIEDRKHRASA